LRPGASQILLTGDRPGPRFRRLAAELLLVAGIGLGCSMKPTPGPIDPAGQPTFVVKEVKPRDDMKIVAYGDMRFTSPSNTTDTNPRVRKWLVDKIAEENPDALFVSGDLPFIGAENKDWDYYRSETAPWTTAKLRVYPTLGNHELIPEEIPGLKNYFAQFPWLGKRRWYSVQLGSVYLIALDSNSGHPEHSFDADAPQQKWLDAQLAHLPAEVNFVFFLTHMPLINDVQSEVIADIPGPSMVKLRRYLEAQASRSHAKFIVVCGHVHNYERFEQGGISYIVSGGGGAKPYPVYVRSPQDLYRDPGFPNFNYLVLMVHDKQADATMYRVADPKAPTLTAEVKDRFTLNAK
jgi:hypothetical protein